jgi:uncharacterized LabA/DUF88 family protein
MVNGNGKVAIFVDGKNFYEGLRASGLTTKINFHALAESMVRAVKGDILTGLHYFTGIEPMENGDDKKETAEEEQKGSLENFLSFLETQPGCFVYRFPRRNRKVACNKCGHEHFYTEEKAVDTSLVSIMIRQAAISAFDTAVLCSGDADHSPALEALRDLGKPAWVATFSGHGLSRRLRQMAYGHIDLSEVYDEYAHDDNKGEEKNYNMVSALMEAEEYFGKDRYVGANMFINEWRSANLPRDREERKRLLQVAIDGGEIETYEAKDGCRAIRTLQSDEEGNDSPNNSD